MLERIAATLVGFVVMMAVAIGLSFGMEISPFISGVIGFIVFIPVYRATRRGIQRLRKQE